jgi:hypothetical protein
MTNNNADDVVPFRIEIEQAEIDRLHCHLDETRWPPALPGDNWDTGVPVAWLRELSGVHLKVGRTANSETIATQPDPIPR